MVYVVCCCLLLLVVCFSCSLVLSCSAVLFVVASVLVVVVGCDAVLNHVVFGVDHVVLSWACLCCSGFKICSVSRLGSSPKALCFKRKQRCGAKHSPV